MDSVYNPTSKAYMVAGFPESPGAIVGRPKAKLLFMILRHLCDWAQLHQVKGNNDLNLLHIAVQDQMYQYFLMDL